LRLALTHVGHEVETAADGYEGLDRFGTGSGWDLVLLDQRMPGLEGLEVLKEMRTRQPLAHIIMITAFGTIDLATEAMIAGATDFLRKPFTVETLRSAVTAALSTTRSTLSRSSGERGTLRLPYAFDKTNVNGFRLYAPGGVAVARDGGISDTFTVESANGEKHACRVNLPPYMVELVKAHADRDAMPDGERFWEALCGEALANHLWQHAEFPEGELVVDDLTSGLRHWVDAVLSSSGK
jgi:CheY-like chemotaxis protein